MRQVMTRRAVLRTILGATTVAVGSGLLAACRGTAVTPTVASGAAGSTPAATAVPSPGVTPTVQPTPTPSPTPTRTPTAFKFGTARQIASLTAYIGIEKGFFKDEGIALEIAEIQTLGQMVPFLGTGEILAAGGALSAALFNAIRQGIGLKAVACRTALLRGFTFHCLMTAKQRYDSGAIRSLADLRGKTIANTNVEGLVAWENAKILASAGLTLNDVQLVGMAAPDMPTALANGAVDAALLIEPYCVVARRLDAGVVLVEGDGIRDLVGVDVPIGVVLFSPKLLADRELAVAWLRAHLRAARFYNDALRDPARKSEVIDIASKYLPIQDRTLYEEMIWPGIPADGRFDPAFVDELQKFMIERGEIKEALPVDQVVDLSFLEEALRTLTSAA
ncbi:hypothetical protein HRbin28_02550 [bacterium HR28]|nr:hypothetical protein HRbin28_02550 [bacterium HR28]